MYHNEFAQEFEQEALGYEQQEAASQEMFEFNPEFLGELSGEQHEFSGEQYEHELSGELTELQELELAHELLEISNEQELNLFLGKLIKGVGKAFRNFANSPIGRGIGNALKTVGKVALPLAGKVLGSFVGGPLGGMIGGKLGSAASNLFELELEGLSPEDREFETARAFVRFAHSAARHGAALQRRGGLPPQQAVRTALGTAARQYAPGLLRRTPGRMRDARGRFTATAGRFAAPGAARRPMGMRGGLGGPAGVPRYGVGPNFSSYALGGANLATGASGGVQDAGYDVGPDGPGVAPDPDFAGNDPDYGYPQGGNGPSQGTWYRQGRTIIVQL